MVKKETYLTFISLIKKTNRKGCIRLDCPEYFQHGTSFKDKLNKKEISNLIDFLKTQHKRFINVDFRFTNFDYMLMLWNDNNPDYQIEVDNMPDYNNL